MVLLQKRDKLPGGIAVASAVDYSAFTQRGETAHIGCGCILDVINIVYSKIILFACGPMPLWPNG